MVGQLLKTPLLVFFGTVNSQAKFPTTPADRILFMSTIQWPDNQCVNLLEEYNWH